MRYYVASLPGWGLNLSARILNNSRNSDPRSYIGITVGSSAPPHSRAISTTPTVRALIFNRDMISALSSLVDSRRIVPTHAILGALDSWCHFFLEIKNSCGDSNP